jgi:hypothetical protein
VTCAEIARDAAGLAALPADDAERAAAYAHAAGCPGCRAALAKGQALSALLGALPAPEPPSPAVLARVERELRAESARARTRVGRAAAAAVVVAIALLIVFARHRDGDPGAWIASAVVGLIAVGLAATCRSWAVAAAVVASAGFAAIAGAGGGPSSGDGIHCLLSELVAGGLALGAATVAARRAGAPLSPALLGAMAAAGALGGQAALNLVCPARDIVGHLFALHTGGVLIAAALGAGIGRLRSRRAMA